MLSSDFIAMAFRVINFIVVISIFIYLFRRYILKDLKLNIFNNKNYFVSLDNKSKELEDRSNKLDFEISYQEHLSKELINKIYKWKETHQKKMNDEIKEKDLISKKLIEKVKIQETLLTFENLKKEIIPVVVENAQTNLVKEFEMKNKALQFQGEIVEFMKKN